jgi:hypothetical protein
MDDKEEPGDDGDARPRYALVMTVHSLPPAFISTTAALSFQWFFPPFDPSHKFVTSPFIRSPLILALVRLILALYSLLALLVSLIWQTVRLGEGKACVLFF